MLTTTEAIDKVRKLLALSTSSNENEAAAAAARAAAIMESHRIDAAMLLEAEQRDNVRDDARGREDFAMNDTGDLLAARSHKKSPTWYWGLAWYIAKANRCSPHRKWGGKGYHIAFGGRPADAAACKYMLDAIANDVDRLAALFLKRYPSQTRSAGASFRLGCVRTIGERLSTTAKDAADQRRRELAAAGDQTGLVRLDQALATLSQDDDQLRGWLGKRGITYGKARRTNVSSADAYYAGQRAGQNVRLSGGSARVGSGARALKAV